MTIRSRTSFCFLVLTMLAVSPVAAQIDTAIIEKNRAALEKQSTDKDMKRERGTQPEDWIFTLPEGVTSRQITFYSDNSRCYGRIFFPKGFASSQARKWPGVVVGHGINAQAVGIEKYAARFAERGLVSMAIDYRTYGYSSGDVLLLEPDTSTTNASYRNALRAYRSKGPTSITFAKQKTFDQPFHTFRPSLV